jgi:Yip1-like protein
MQPATDFDQKRMQLTARAKKILMQPAGEWPVIAAERSDVVSLLRDYAAPLAAIPAICRWIGMSIVGVPIPLFGTYRVGIVRGFASAIVSWVFALVGAWIAAVIIEKLAPTFQSKGDTTQALKLVVYASTPVWVAGVLNLIPALSVLIIVAALYAVYLFYLGLPSVMSTPTEKVIPYMAVSAIVVIVVTFVLGLFAAAMSGVGGYRTF